ncbi:hypothetical protein [Halorarum halobium]|nr:hypothetical protein [Halobaculum sp. XH14]
MDVKVDGIEIAPFNVDGEYHALSNRWPTNVRRSARLVRRRER